LSVSTTDYETLVTSDDDIPNKKYVDDAISVTGSNPNIIINGDFRVAQRGTSFPAMVNATWVADRWSYSKS